jgi:hypothetical protein
MHPRLITVHAKGYSLNPSLLGGKQSSEFCTRGGEQRELDTVLAHLSAFRSHPAVNNYKKRRLQNE